MNYTLARMRQQKPKAPFWVGGEYLVMNNLPYLKDAFHIYELAAPAKLLESLRPGDLALVQVTEYNEEQLSAADVKQVQAKASERERPVAKFHAARFPVFVDEVRALLKKRGLTELYTPSLVTCPGLEPSLEAFAVEDKYLPTSPEIHLKKAMARGHHDIFEIRSCFRRKESGAHHATEFSMLEWYRGFADLNAVIRDLEALLKELGHWGRKPALPRVTDFQSLFKEVCDFDLRPETSAAQLRAIAPDHTPDDSFADLFHRVMIEKIEPAMVAMGPLIVRRFPPELAALARLDLDGWADRFEFYWNGLEIANAFYEVTDPQEQRERWAKEQAERARLKTTPLPIDEELIQALEMGLPPTGGIALGLERLYMAFTGTKDIKDLRTF